MEFRVNLVELSRQIFGIGGISIDEAFNKRPIDYDEEKIEVREEAETVGNSVLGTPIYESLRVINPETDEWFEFEDAPALMTVNLEKKIIRNSRSGKSGTVKEYTATGDYAITVRGMIVKTQSDALDYERIDKLHQIERINKMLEVESNLLNTLGVDNIVIRSIEHPGGEGFTNVYPFVWQCLSDDDVQLNKDRSSSQASFDAYSTDERKVFGV